MSWIKILYHILMILPLLFKTGDSFLTVWRKQRSEIRAERKKARRDRQNRKVGKERKAQDEQAKHGP